MSRSTAIPPRRHKAPMLLVVARTMVWGAILVSPPRGPAQAAPPWGPVRNTAPQKAASRVNENRPIYYPRLAHVGDGGRTVAAADRLLYELVDLHTAMSYQEAAAVAEHLVQMTPHRPQVHYNRACVMGRLRRGDEALSSLEQAVNCGWRDLVHLSIDPDLDSVRDTARYAELTRRLRQLIAAESAAPPAPRDLAGDIRREAASALHNVGVSAVTVALVNDGRVSWMTSSPTDGTRLRVPGRDDPVEVTSVVRLFALVALLGQQPHDAGVLADLGLGRGPVLRQTSHGPGQVPAADEAELIKAAETAARQPFASYCRTHILGPLRMDHTRFAEPPGVSGPVVYSTAGDLGRLLAALCTPATDGVPVLLDETSIDRLIAVGRRFGLAVVVEQGAPAAGLEMTHRCGQDAALLRWYPQRGRGVVVVTRGGDGIPAARRIAGLALRQ